MTWREHLCCMLGWHDWTWLTGPGHDDGDLYCRRCLRIRWAHPEIRRLELERAWRDRRGARPPTDGPPPPVSPAGT